METGKDSTGDTQEAAPEILTIDQLEDSGFMSLVDDTIDLIMDIDLAISLRLENGLLNQDALIIYPTILENLIPIISFLVSPRSVSSLLQIERSLLESIQRKNFTFLPDSFILSHLLYLDPNKTWSYIYDLLIRLKYFDHNSLAHAEEIGYDISKILSWRNHMDWREEVDICGGIINTRDLSTAVAVIRRKWEEHEFPGRVVVIPGKWRLGVHDEHAQLFQLARQVAGNGGLVIAWMESRKSILHSHPEEDYFVVEDEERLTVLSAIADFAVLVDPSDSELGSHEFSNRMLDILHPDFLLIGARTHEDFEAFKALCFRLGTKLLWGKERQTRSNTGIIRDLQGKI